MLRLGTQLGAVVATSVPLFFEHVNGGSSNFAGCPKMADQQTLKNVQEQLPTQARTFGRRLSAFEASRGVISGLQEASAGGDQTPTGFEGAGTSRQAA